MKLALVIIVCIGLYTAGADPSKRKSKKKWLKNNLKQISETFTDSIRCIPNIGKSKLDGDYLKILEMAEKHAKNTENGQEYKLCKEILDKLKPADEEFKSMCIEAFVSKCGPKNDWDSSKNGIAYETLDEQICHWYHLKYKQFFEMSCKHANKDPINFLRIPTWCHTDNVYEDFIFQCVEAFAKIPRIDSDSSKKDMCKTAYDTLNEQIGLYTAQYIDNSEKKNIIDFDRNYLRFLEMSYNHAKNPGDDRIYNLPAGSMHKLKGVGKDFKNGCIAAFENECGPSSKWDSSKEDMCKTAYVTLSGQIKIRIDGLDQNWAGLLNEIKLKEGFVDLLKNELEKPQL